MDASPLRTVTILASPFSERCVFLQGVTRRFSDRLLAKHTMCPARWVVYILSLLSAPTPNFQTYLLGLRESGHVVGGRTPTLDQHLEELLEDHPVRYAGAMTAQRVVQTCSQTLRSMAVATMRGKARLRRAYRGGARGVCWTLGWPSCPPRGTRWRSSPA